MKFFNSQIHAWYSLYKRDLPWRNTRDPYCIWLSEIILQQTRINQGLAYYLRFINEFPTVSDLANASEDKILKLWQGLGYYSRARNLLFTAKYLHSFYGGIFPNDYNSIIKLKGIGDYTAAAISSISFNLEYSTVDGNVYRILSRYFGITDPIDTTKGKKLFSQLAAELIKGTNAGMHNQALMEFGALQCIPRNPSCNDCPLKDKCFAYLFNQINELPVKQNKTKQRNRYFNYLVFVRNSETWLRKRTGKDIWENLYEFPYIETQAQTNINELVTQNEFRNLIGKNKFNIEKISNWKIHILSHQRIHYCFIRINLESEIVLEDQLVRVNKEDIFNFAVPKLLESYLHEI